jgi:hypothetical protein
MLVMVACTMISWLTNDLLILVMGVGGVSSARTGKGTIKFVHKARTKMGKNHRCSEASAEMSPMDPRGPFGFGTLGFPFFSTMYANGISTIGRDCSSPQAERQEKT